MKSHCNEVARSPRFSGWSYKELKEALVIAENAVTRGNDLPEFRQHDIEWRDDIENEILARDTE